MKRYLIGGQTIATALAFLLLLTATASAAPTFTEQPEDGWTTFKNDEFGYSLYYPSAYFEPNAIAASGEPKTFLSPDGRAKLVVSGADNDEGFSLNGYRRTLLETFGGYDELDYSPKGRSWFVLSGFRGDTIYYQKVMFSCRERIINVFSVTFPSAEKAFYERLIEIMDDNFHPDRGAGISGRCRSS